MIEARDDDLRRLLLRALNENQVLILAQIGRSNERVSKVLQCISTGHSVPLSTLKLNAQILRELNLITYGLELSGGARLTSLGRSIVQILDACEPQAGDVMEVQVHAN